MKINKTEKLRTVANILKTIMVFLVLPGSFFFVLQSLWEISNNPSVESSEAGFGLILVGPQMILFGLLITGIIYYAGIRSYNQQ